MTIHISDIHVIPPDSNLFWGYNLDVPVVGQEYNGFHFTLYGWVLPREVEIRSVEICSSQIVLFSGEVDAPRPDVAVAFPNVQNAGQCGFALQVETLLLGEQFDLHITLRLKDGRTIPVARIIGERRAFACNFTPTIQPLTVLGLGRSGTTLLMRYLSSHPMIVVHSKYPYETMPLSYWLHMFRILTAPSDQLHSTNPETLVKDIYHIGYYPYLSDSFDPVLSKWLYNYLYPETAKFCMLGVEESYLGITFSEKKSSPSYCAEKFKLFSTYHLQWLLYPKARSILIVRDFRDRFCSVREFNEKRGFDGFNLNKFTSFEEYILDMRREFEFGYRVWHEHKDRVHLIRYEDLILKPRETLTALFTSLEVSATNQLVENVLRLSEEDTADLRFHRTTEHPKESIGRWKYDLEPNLQSYFREHLGDLLSEFDYEV